MVHTSIDQRYENELGEVYGWSGSSWMLLGRWCQRNFGPFVASGFDPAPYDGFDLFKKAEDVQKAIAGFPDCPGRSKLLALADELTQGIGSLQVAGNGAPADAPAKAFAA